MNLLFLGNSNLTQKLEPPRDHSMAILEMRIPLFDPSYFIISDCFLLLMHRLLTISFGLSHEGRICWRMQKAYDISNIILHEREREREREREKQGGRYTHFKVEIYNWLHVPSNEILLHGSYNLTRHDAPISPEQLLIFTYFLENSSTIHMFLVHY